MSTCQGLMNNFPIIYLNLTVGNTSSLRTVYYLDIKDIKVVITYFDTSVGRKCDTSV